jgi:hypothetical protein
MFPSKVEKKRSGSFLDPRVSSYLAQWHSDCTSKGSESAGSKARKRGSTT